MHWIHVRRTALVAACLCLQACGSDPESMGPAVVDRVTFNWDVRPILSDNCFSCHGFDAGGRKAGLRLDSADSAFQVLPESPGKYAIVPERPEQSELLRRITAENPDERMPPPESNKGPLSPLEIAVLTKWIEDGAEYETHWAFSPPTEPEIPAVERSGTIQVANEIDQFIFARLEREEVTPSPPADKETLINRVYMTLSGVPPTLEEVDEFLSDNDPEAYEKVVERVLASSAYGERMATFWLDLARWAETDGFLDDHHDRFVWPWRDWVIDAFNENMPFDEFATLQLAGDLLPERTREQRLATAFLRLGKRTTENGAIDEEYRNEYAVDRTEAVGNTFLALTLGCARCHDHKYDPVSHQDFYSFTGFFDNNDEPGFYAPGHTGIQGGPTLLWPDAATQLKIDAAAARLRERLAAYETTRALALQKARIAAQELSQKSPAEIQQLLASSVQTVTTAYFPFDDVEPFPAGDISRFYRESRPPPPQLVSLPRSPQRDSEQRRPSDDPFGVLPQGYVPSEMRYTPGGMSNQAPAVLQGPLLREGVSGAAMFFDEVNKGFLPPEVGYYERTQEFSFDLWFYVGDEYESKVPIINHRDDDNSGGSGYRLELENQQLHFYMAHSRPYNMLALRVPDPLPLQQWTHVAVTYDGSSSISGLRIYVNGQEAGREVIRDNLSQTILPNLNGAQFDRFIGVEFGSRFREKSPVGSGLDELRFFERELAPLEVAYLHGGIESLPGDVQQLSESLEPVIMANSEEVMLARRQLSMAREAENSLVSYVPEVLIMEDSPVATRTHRLDRGVYSEPREEVPVQALPNVFTWDTDLPRNRLGLAQWLFDLKNPLTARVFVNRIWSMHFGRGLVETSEDFGTQGAIPSHPDLLDWLAVEFVESGWDIKHLHKLIVMSTAYRQSSDVSEELLARDPSNELLARGIRMRMSAELVRDNALAAAGLLVNQVGGPSVHPYQPSGIWSSIGSFYRYPTSDAVPADEHHRRSLYTFVKRNAPPPGMQIFDSADRNVSVARRKVSNTPLQALTLMNDPQFVEAYRVLAQRAMESSADLSMQIQTVFRLARRETPSAAQLDALSAYFDDELRRFASDPQAAMQAISAGVAPVSSRPDAAHLAALASVTSVVMNTPDAYTIR